ncbi:YciI family protein [Pseudonocardia sp.]|uniref:YciI family protein n=1 Tax=Pseudonocardia sp. TaxID=60912 RepID=UPI003D0D6812
MHYLVLLYGDETGAPEPGTPEFDAELAGYAAFDEHAAGAIRGGAALHLTERARTIRHDGAAVTVTDGPFAETTEVLGGYYVLECTDLDEVIELVRAIPATSHPRSAAEVRPMLANEALRPEGEMLPDLWLATLHRGGAPGTETGGAETGPGVHDAFVRAHRPQLVRVGTLHPATSATTVRVREGGLQVVDGPFDPRLAVVDGFYVLQADADKAETLAREIPVGDGGAVELRPIVDLTAM